MDKKHNMVKRASGDVREEDGKRAMFRSLYAGKW
jgi:hypothetical protein